MLNLGQWRHSLLTRVDKVQGPRDASGICKYFFLLAHYAQNFYILLSLIFISLQHLTQLQHLLVQSVSIYLCINNTYISRFHLVTASN